MSSGVTSAGNDVVTQDSHPFASMRISSATRGLKTPQRRNGGGGGELQSGDYLPKHWMLLKDLQDLQDSLIVGIHPQGVDSYDQVRRDCWSV